AQDPARSDAEQREDLCSGAGVHLPLSPAPRRPAPAGAAGQREPGRDRPAAPPALELVPQPAGGPHAVVQTTLLPAAGHVRDPGITPRPTECHRRLSLPRLVLRLGGP